MGQSEHLQPLGVVEQLFEVSPDRVVGEIQGEKGAEAHEDVVREDGEPVVGQGEAQQLEGGGEHGRVKVLDVIMGEV